MTALAGGCGKLRPARSSDRIPGLYRRSAYTTASSDTHQQDPWGKDEQDGDKDKEIISFPRPCAPSAFRRISVECTTGLDTRESFGSSVSPYANGH